MYPGDVHFYANNVILVTKNCHRFSYSSIINQSKIPRFLPDLLHRFPDSPPPPQVVLFFYKFLDFSPTWDFTLIFSWFSWTMGTAWGANCPLCLYTFHRMGHNYNQQAYFKISSSFNTLTEPCIVKCFIYKWFINVCWQQAQFDFNSWWFWIKIIIFLNLCKCLKPISSDLI